MTFSHYFSFETFNTTIGYDGGIIEISTDNGATWTDVLSAGGSFTSGAGYNGSFVGLSSDGSTLTPNDDGGHVGFVNNNGSLSTRVPQFVTLSFGDTYAGQNLRLRFREVTDVNGSSFGWWVDNVSFIGLANLPFSAVVAEDNVPDNHAPVANAGPDQNVLTGDVVTLDGSASTDDVAVTRYAWIQVSGPAASLTGADSASPTFPAVAVGTYVFKLTVLDARNASSSDFVSIVTSERDITPNQFTFNDVSDVEPGSVQTSNAITVSGIDAPSPFSVAGGMARLNGEATCLRTSGAVVSSNTLAVCHVASSSFDAATDTTLTIGNDGVLLGVSDTFTSRTRVGDAIPDRFRFNDVSNAPLSSVQTSNTVIITGIETPTPISISGGQYSIGCLEAGFTGDPGMIGPGQSVCVRVMTSHQNSVETRARLNVGGVGGGFSATTLAGDSTPDAFQFIDLNDVPLHTPQTSNSVTVTGLTMAAPISITKGQYSIGCVKKGFTSAPGMIQPGQSVCVRYRSSSKYSDANGTTLSVGSVSDTFTTTTIAAPVP